MPIFEYKCTSCGHVTEVLERPGRKSRPTCPECESKSMEKLFSGFGLGGSACAGTSPASCATGASQFG